MGNAFEVNQHTQKEARLAWENTRLKALVGECTLTDDKHRASDIARIEFITLGVFMLPIVIVIWAVPWFVTQDGPSHLYNAYLISELLTGNVSVQEFYILHWKPLPNLAGHWLLVALMQMVSARTADQILMTLTSVGLVGVVVWLRWLAAGWKGLAQIIPLAVLLALNTMWLKGFYNFSLGTCLFAITLGYWWANRQQMGLDRAVILMGLLVLGYFCHLVSALLTVFGLVLLALMTPGPHHRARCSWTAISLTPLVPLGFLYYWQIQAAGGVQPTWMGLPGNHWSLAGWFRYLGSADPFPPAATNVLPLVEWTSPWFVLLHPSLWLAVGLLALILGTFFPRTEQDEPRLRTSRGWLILAFCLTLGWAVAPSHLGTGHGGFLRMRFLPLALIAMVPIFKLDSRHVSRWIGVGALAVAVIIRLAAVGDVAMAANQSAPAFIEALPSVGTGKRIGTLIIDMPSRAKAYPLLHMDKMLAIGTGNILWHNYEAVQYYFPVQYRNPLVQDIAREFFKLQRIQTSDPNLEGRIERWTRLLTEHHRKVDVLLVWGVDARFDQINRQWYGPEPVYQQGNLRVFHHR